MGIGRKREGERHRTKERKKEGEGEREREKEGERGGMKLERGGFLSRENALETFLKIINKCRRRSLLLLLRSDNFNRIKK